MTAEPSVFVALIEVEPLEGCFLDRAKHAGAYVRCYVPAASRDKAIRLLKYSLSQNAFKLAEIEWCVNHADVEWEHPDNNKASESIQEALHSGEVVYSEFHAWGFDAD